MTRGLCSLLLVISSSQPFAQLTLVHASKACVAKGAHICITKGERCCMKGNDLGLGGGGKVPDSLLGEVDFGTLHRECIECGTRCLGEEVSL